MWFSNSFAHRVTKNTSKTSLACVVFPASWDLHGEMKWKLSAANTPRPFNLLKKQENVSPRERQYRDRNSHAVRETGVSIEGATIELVRKTAPSTKSRLKERYFSFSASDVFINRLLCFRLSSRLFALVRIGFIFRHVTNVTQLLIISRLCLTK